VGITDKNQTQKRMKKTILRSMAPLVAGIILLAQTGIGMAAYPFIGSISKGSTSANVSVAEGGSIPPGHAGPRKPDSNNYYWWVDQQSHSSGSTSTTYLSATNVAVYVYPDDNSNDYSYAIVDDVDGTTIWNGP
jgi:hypothetical protein